MLKGLTESIRREQKTKFLGNDESDGERNLRKFKTGFNFELKDGLIYSIEDGKHRLCLLSSMEMTKICIQIYTVVSMGWQ